jgi:hypothetical protein
MIEITWKSVRESLLNKDLITRMEKVFLTYDENMKGREMRVDLMDKANPCPLHPWKETQCRLYRRLSKTQGPSWQVQNISFS